METRTLLILGIVIMILAVAITRDLAAAALVASLMANFFTLEQHVSRTTAAQQQQQLQVQWPAHWGPPAPLAQAPAVKEGFGSSRMDRPPSGRTRSVDDASTGFAISRSRMDGIVERGANINHESYGKWWASEMKKDENREWWGDYDN